LILGDSLSFGEGIDIKDRFDVRMLSFLPATRVINTGTMGYGTDQECALGHAVVAQALLMALRH